MKDCANLTRSKWRIWIVYAELNKADRFNNGAGLQTGSRNTQSVLRRFFHTSAIFLSFFLFSFLYRFDYLRGLGIFFYFFIFFFFKNMRIFRVFKKNFFGLVLDSQIGWESNALLNSILFGLSRKLQPFLHFGHNHILGFVVLMICWGIAPILKMVWWLGSGSFGIVMDGILLKIE